MILNIFLFVPLGVGLALARVRPRTALLIAALVSGLVEVAQLYVPGRDASIGDLIWNTVGGGFGFALVTSARHWTTPPDAQKSWWSLSASLVATAILVLTGVMLQPTYTDHPYSGQWTPKLGHLDWYEGEVLHATVGSRTVPSGRLEDSRAIRDLLRNGSSIRVTAVAGPPTSQLSALFGIADTRQNIILLIGPRGDHLLYLPRMRAESFRLDRPVLDVPDVMDLTPGDTIEVRVWRDGAAYCATVNQDQVCGLGFTVGSGWTLLQYSESFPLWLTRVLNPLWLCLLLVPVGYWSRPNVYSVLGAVVLVAGLALAPAVTGLLATTSAEWIGAGLGVVIGMFLRFTVTRRLTTRKPDQIRAA